MTPLRIALLFVFATAHAAAAQLVPFGKNKIQYDDFEWQVLEGEHVDVYYYPEEEEVARLALASAEESYADLERLFQHHPFRRIPLIVYSSDQHFEQTNLLPGFIPEGVLGFTEYLKRRVALPFRGDYAQFRHTLKHELIHAFQLSKLAEVGSVQARRRPFSPQQIHWWTEGLAEFWSSTQTTEDEMFVRDIILNGRLPSIEQFSTMYSFMSYPLGGELHRYLAERFGTEYIVRMYEDHWRYPSFEAALEGILGVDLERLSREWKYDLEQRHFPAYATRPPLDVGARTIVDRGGANFKPLLDARGEEPMLLFFSPRSGYTSLYRTPLGRGEDGVELVIEGERSAEFESFHAYYSGMDVSAGGVVAFASKFMERDALFLWSQEDRRIVGRYQWDDLVGVRSPAWAPDGRSIVFEGLSRSGFSDLYVIDFDTHERRALTQDRYRDGDPDWSHDGSTIVFASDRTEFGRSGFTNLVALDVASGAMRFLTYGEWTDAAPRFSRDGTRIAFSSDRTGSYDLYTIDSAGDGLRRTTFTGGAFDPEWLPADQGLLFTGYQNGRYTIYRHDFRADTTTLPQVALAPDAPQPASGNVAPGALAGTDAGPPPTWTWDALADEQVRTADTRAYESLEGISLDFAAADALVVPGIGSAQGAQFVATDMLGNHIVGLGVTAVQGQDLSSLVDSFSGSLVYLNLSSRLNWGVGAYRYKGLFRDVAYDIYEEETYGGYAIASYPFSRYRRVEVQVGVEQSDRLDLEDIHEVGFDDAANRRDLTRRGTLASNILSYVHDNSLFLNTGPIDGQRFNASVGLVSCFACSVPSPVTGLPVDRGASAESWLLSVDYRRYFRTSLYSAYAVRGYGFVSGGAIPHRSILGGPHRLRGYPRFSLAGSRVWLVNQEWRFPIIHAIGFALPWGELRLPGIQGAVFVDAGSSWLEDTSPPEGIWGSYGGAFRMALGPFAVLRLDVGRRFTTGDAPPVVFSSGERFHDTFVDFFIGYNF